MHWHTLSIENLKDKSLALLYRIVHIGFQTGFRNVTGFNFNFSMTVFFPCAGVSFWLRGTNYQNNSLVSLEDIGEGYDEALLCVTDQPACCRSPYSDSFRLSVFGNWFFPNGTRVPSSSSQWDMHRTRGHMVLPLHRRRGGAKGIYHCVIPDAMDVSQTVYIGVYTANTGEW